MGALAPNKKNDYTSLSVLYLNPEAEPASEMG